MAKLNRCDGGEETPQSHSSDILKFRFGLFEADLKAEELRKSGIRIRLQRQPFRILIFLLERSGQVVSREEIQKHFWGAQASVDLERSLATAVHKIRECLDDSVVNPRFIETLARSGYRFIAPVTLISAKPPAEPPAQTTLQASADEVQAIATLPVEIASAVAHGIRRGSFWVMIALVGVLASAAGYFARSRTVGRLSAPAHLVQVTFSNRLAFSDPLFQGFAGTATDGSRIYFSQMENGRIVLAEVLIANGETNTLPLPQELAAPSVDDISPDNSQLLLRDCQWTNSEQPLWIASTMSGAAHRIPGILAHAATWAPDGSSIVYATGNDLYMAHEDGTRQRKLVTLQGRAFRLRWSPDGSNLRLTLINDETHTPALWQVSAADWHAQDLLSRWHVPGATCCGSWTADGKYYVFQATAQGQSNVWALPEQGRLLGSSESPVPVTDGPLSYQAPLPARLGHKIFFIGRKINPELLQVELHAGAPLISADFYSADLPK